MVIWKDYTIELIEEGGAPSNDACANAQLITPNPSCNPTPGTSENATEDMPAATCSGQTAANANEVWYMFNANGISSYTIQVSGNGGFNPVLEYFTSCDPASSQGCADATGADGTETIHVGTLPSGVFYYRVYGNGAEGTFTTCVTEISNAPETNDCVFSAMDLTNRINSIDQNSNPFDCYADHFSNSRRSSYTYRN